MIVKLLASQEVPSRSLLSGYSQISVIFFVLKDYFLELL